MTNEEFVHRAYALAEVKDLAACMFGNLEAVLVQPASV
jgi:hypothetical protein